MPFAVSYRYWTLQMLLEPGMLIGFFLAVFLIIIALLRFDLSLVRINCVLEMFLILFKGL